MDDTKTEPEPEDIFKTVPNRKDYRALGLRRSRGRGFYRRQAVKQMRANLPWGAEDEVLGS